MVGIVLCGGASRRMGSDKALLQIDGVPMAQRVAEALLGCGLSAVMAVGGDGPALTRSGLRFVADRWPGAGPLGGIVSALESTEAPVVVVAACDLVHPSAGSFGRLVASLVADERADVAVPLLDGRRQFDQLAIRRARAHPHLRSAFDGGVRSIHGGLNGLAVHEVAGLAPATLQDADTPSDLPLR
jgi:molybdopterin-guanine dinucleotide biosynthesis protein A